MLAQRGYRPNCVVVTTAIPLEHVLGIALQPLFARFQELSAPAVIDVLIQAFSVAQFSRYFLAAKFFQNNTDLTFR